METTWKHASVKMPPGVKPKPDASAVLNYLRARRDYMIALLEHTCRAESPSTDPASQIEIREIIAIELERMGFRVRRIPGRSSGGMLYASIPGHHGKPSQLILGHYDTVWPRGTLRDMPFKVEGDWVSGPGVYDMKGGIIQALLALQTLRHFTVDLSVSPAVFFNSDEEIGSRESSRYIAALAPHMDRVFVLEPSLGSQGQLKTARKGIGQFTITIHGEAAHAGLDPGAGASAILELSHVIQALFALNDLENGITINVGTIDGGLRPNVVAPHSSAVADVRVATQIDARQIEKQIRELKPSIPGTSLSITGGFGRPVMEKTPANSRLWLVARDLGTQLGLHLEDGSAGGGSDGNTTSQYAATLDGLGAVGDGAHARHEHMHIGKSLERTALLTLLLMENPLFQNPGEADSPVGANK
jgi:glutamate carboxypeptidase